jgi:selenoprotein W-related protein
MPSNAGSTSASADASDTPPKISIRYCTGCRWLLRAGWLAQELLSTFEQDVSEVALIPDDTGGVFDVRIGEQLVWSRAEQGRFPEPKEIKQLVRDLIAPGRDLGHIDN